MGDPKIVRSMDDFAQLSRTRPAGYIAEDHDRLSQLINRNFDLRNSIYA